jgi:CRP-like cAMP-binding protein
VIILNQSYIEKSLSEAHLFKDLSPKELSPFVEVAQTRNYKRKMYVFMEDDPLDRIFFIDTGKVKINKSDLSGREQILYVLEPGDMFPHAGFFRHGSYPSHAEVMEDANLIMIPIDKFEEILITHPDLCIKLFKVLGERIIDLQKRLEAKTLHTTYEQIVLLLIRLCKSNGMKIGNQYQLTTHFTNQELANMVGTSRETVSRTITYLRKKNYIIPNDQSHLLINRLALKEEVSL